MENNKRKLIKASDIVIILILIIICISAIIYMKVKQEMQTDTGIVAQISYKGKVVKEVKLDTSNDIIFKLDENQNVSFQIKDHKIRFINTQCPDKLCENFGYLEKSNETTICLPNFVSLRLIGNDENTVDIIV